MAAWDEAWTLLEEEQEVSLQIQTRVEKPRSQTAPAIEENLLRLCEGDQSAIGAISKVKGFTSLLLFGNFWDSDEEMLAEMSSLGMPETVAKIIAKEAKKACQKQRLPKASQRDCH